MEESYSFLPNKINISNLHFYSSKLSIIEEQKICELAEIASDTALFIKKMLNEDLGYYDIIYMLVNSNFSKSEINLGKCLEHNTSHLMSFNNISNLYDKCLFCSLVFEYLWQEKIFPTEKDFFKDAPERETFVYVKNAYSDEAYDVFSQDFKDPRVRYAQSFKDALKLVYDNIVSFCLLPIEERGVRLPTVDELIFRGDYKINAVIPVFGFDGNADLKYALVSKNLYSISYEADDDRYFEIRIPIDTTDALTSLSLCAEEFSLKIHRINTIGFRTEEGESNYLSVVFKSFGTDFSKLLFYLTVFLPEYIPVGIYKNLE